MFKTCTFALDDATFRSFRVAGISTTAVRSTPSSEDHRTRSGFWNITIDTVSRRAVSVTRKPTP
jgi:hypothetical protein